MTDHEHGPTAGWPSALVAIPVFGFAELTDALLGDLLRDPFPPSTRVVVVDNAGDYELPEWAAAVEVYRPGTNLRWIGTANWTIAQAIADGLDLAIVLNNDIRLSVGFLTALMTPQSEVDDAAIVAACYDDFWIHQRATEIPPVAAEHRPRPVLRDVPFCDGTAISFSVPAMTELRLPRRAGSEIAGAGNGDPGGEFLDTEAFPRHGYGSDIDLALRARAAGWRCVVTEGAYVSHLRRQTMTRTGQSAELNRAEILTGLDAKWGATWRPLSGLGPGAFPPHNTGSSASWYLDTGTP